MFNALYAASPLPCLLYTSALLSGITLDTKNFVLKTGVRTFEAAAYLRRRGADTVEVKRMFSDSIAAYKLSLIHIFNIKSAPKRGRRGKVCVTGDAAI